MKNSAINFLKKYWPVIAVLLIIGLGTSVRMLDYRWPYLRNIDSYNFARQFYEISQNGQLLPRDDLSNAPYGVDRGNVFGQELYIYFGGLLFRLVEAIRPATSFFQYLLWFPPLLISLCAIPMYFIGKMLYDRRAGVLAAFFFIFDTSIMSRTLGGDPDSDAITLIMPLIAMAFFLFAYKYANRTKKIDIKYIAYTALAGITLGLWGYTWSGYWYLVWLITGFIALTIILDLVRTRKLTATAGRAKHSLLVYFVVIILFFLITIPNLGVGMIQNTITGPFTFSQIKSEDISVFPNVYVSVAELQSAGGIKDIIQLTSAINFTQNPVAMMLSPFFLMLYGLIYLLYSYIRKRQHVDTLFLLLIWFLGPFIATMVGVRFSILFSAPMALGSAILLSKVFRVIQYKEKLED